MRLEHRQLRYFIAVAEELHFGRAANRLHMSQPPLSQQIRQLEEELGTELFERNQRSVKLTFAGEVFLEQARAAIDKLEEAVSTVRAAARGEAGFVRVGYTTAGAYAVIPPLMQSFKQRHPQVEVALFESLSTDQMRDLHENRLDIGIVRPSVDWPGLTGEKLMEERLVVALPSDDALASQSIVDIAALNERAFIGFTQRATYFHRMIESVLVEARVTPRFVQRATQTHAVAALVGAGLGVAIVPDTTARVHLDRVVYRPLHADHLPHPELHLVWRRDSLTPAARNFLACARELAVPGTPLA